MNRLFLPGLPRRGAVVPLSTALPVLLLCAACSVPPAPVQVTAVQVGRSRNADKTVASPTFEFKPTDTIYVAVLTTGSAEDAVVRARWSYGGGVVSDSEQRVSHRERGVTAFELRNGSGFPSGTYKLEIFLNGAPVVTREVRVKY